MQVVGEGGSESNDGRGRGKKKIRSTARFVAVQQAVSPQDVAEGGDMAGWVVVDRVDSGGDGGGTAVCSPVQSALLSTVEMRGGGLGVEICRGGIVRVKWVRGPPPLQSPDPPPGAGNRCPVAAGRPSVPYLVL